jgi:hypothetical protein
MIQVALMIALCIASFVAGGILWGLAYGTELPDMLRIAFRDTRKYTHKERLEADDRARALEATIRTLEKQLSTLADHAARLERNFPTSLEGAVGLEGGYDSTLYPKTSAANNPQNDRLRPVPPPPQSQVVEEPQQPSGAEDEKRHEDCY